jgi:hypothetical protein
MGRLVRTAAFAAAIGVAGLAACGEDSGPDAGEGPGEGGSAPIGAAGGSVQATLGSGGTVRLEVPAGALPGEVTFRIDPAATPAGALGAFRLSPAGQRFIVPATLTVEMPSSVTISDRATIAFRVGDGPRVPSGATSDVGRRRITASLDALYRVSQAPAAAAARHGGRALREDEAVEGTLVEFGYDDIVAEMAAVMALYLANGSESNAVDIEQFMFALAPFSNLTATDQRVANLVASWKSRTCSLYQFAVNSVESFNFASDYLGFARRVREGLFWAQRAYFLGVYATELGYTGCDGVPPGPEEPVLDRIDTFMEVVNRDLALLSPSDTASFTVLSDLRIPGLLDLISQLEFLGPAGNRRGAVIAEVQTQLNRLRAGAYQRCRQSGRQDLQKRLLDREFGSALWVGATPWEVGPLYEDIEFCGFTTSVRLRDAQGANLASNTVGGLEQPGSPTRTLTLDLGQTETLALGGPGAPTPFRALACPSGASNAEQIVASAGPPSGALAEVGRATPAANGAYLATASLDIPTSVLRERSGASDAGSGRLVIARAGATCNGEFVQLQHQTLLTVTYTFGAALRITTAAGALAAATQGTGYSQQLQATGGPGPTYAWSIASGALPAGLALSAGGLISGTPSGTGTSTFTARVENGAATAQASFSITVNPAPPPPVTVTVTTSSLPSGAVNQPYSATLNATGGGGSYTWAATNLPPGLQISTGGVISGTPTTAGSYTVNVTAQTSSGASGSRQLVLNIGAGLRITTTSIQITLPDTRFTPTLPVSLRLIAGGGQGPLSWSLIEGSLPPGVTLATDGAISGNVGVLTGSPTIRVRVTDGVTAVEGMITVQYFCCFF